MRDRFRDVDQRLDVEGSDHAGWRPDRRAHLGHNARYGFQVFGVTGDIGDVVGATRSKRATCDTGRRLHPIEHLPQSTLRLTAESPTSLEIDRRHQRANREQVLGGTFARLTNRLGTSEALDELTRRSTWGAPDMTRTRHLGPRRPRTGKQEPLCQWYSGVRRASAARLGTRRPRLRSWRPSDHAKPSNEATRACRVRSVSMPLIIDRSSFKNSALDPHDLAEFGIPGADIVQRRPARDGATIAPADRRAHRHHRSPPAQSARSPAAPAAGLGRPPPPATPTTSGSR